MALSMRERQAITKEMAKRYAKASKKQRGAMLDELCALAGYNRGYAARLLRHRARAAPRRGAARHGRRALYSGEPLPALRKLWATLDGLCGKRLVAVMAETIAALERFDELRLSDEQRRLLCSASAATLDRLLAPERRRLRLRGRSLTKPGSLLKSQIPMRTFAEWDHGKAGFVEIDLVGHEGGDPRGEFAYSLCLTDVASGWTEPRIVRNRARRWTFEALLDIRADLPFPLLGIDLRQRRRVHQPPPRDLVRRRAPQLHEKPSREQERRLLRRAEELERHPPRDRLRALRQRGGAGPDRRDLRRPAPHA